MAGIYQSPSSRRCRRRTRPTRRSTRTVRSVAERHRLARDAVRLGGGSRRAAGRLPRPRLHRALDSRAQTLVPRNEPLLAPRDHARAAPQTGFDVSHGDDIGLVAQPLLARAPRPRRRAGRSTRVALYSRDFEEVEATVSFIRERVLLATLAALLLALAGGWLVARRLGRRVRGARGGRGRGGARQLRRPAAGGLQGRARPAHAHLQRDAGPAAPGGRRPQGVHRDRLARAAHADLLAGRLRRAAAGRGARRGDAARVPRDDERAGRAPAEAVGGPARPVAPRRRLGPAPARAGRPLRTRPQRRAGVHAGARRSRHRARASRRPRRGRRPSATPSAWPRSCGSCSTTRFATRRRART